MKKTLTIVSRDGETSQQTCYLYDGSVEQTCPQGFQSIAIPTLDENKRTWFVPENVNVHDYKCRDIESGLLIVHREYAGGKYSEGIEVTDGALTIPQDEN